MSVQHFASLVLITVINHRTVVAGENKQGVIGNAQTIQCIHNPIPPHKQKALPDFNHLSFPITEKIHQEVLSLPISSALTNEEISNIITTLNCY
jgi:dTDP-4-amino-4,6-dideoxygalactose transaminase